MRPPPVICCAAAAADVLHCGRCCCKAVKNSLVVMDVVASCYRHGGVAPLKFEVCTCGDRDVDDAQEC